jgi:hypothetical protein
MRPLDDVGDRPRLTPDRWTRICAVLDELSESSAAQAAAVLAHACRCHQLDRGEVERLLQCTPDATFLERLPDDLLHEVFAASPESEIALRFPPGSILQQRYHMLASLGSGGMGEVYRARDLALDQTVALKFLSADVTGHAEGVAPLVNEVAVARGIAHPGICRVHDLGFADGIPFISMELIEGETLDQRLRRQGTPSLDEARSLMHQLCEALAAAHEQGIVHCDLKPSNVMVTPTGQVKVTDFGVAGLITALERRTGAFGTAAYLPPERLAGAPPTCASDVYALGVLLLDLLVGTNATAAVRPGRHARVRRLAARSAMRTARVPRDVADLIDSCLHEDPHARPASARQVLDELTKVIWEPEVRPLSSPAATRRRAAVLVLLALAGLIGVVEWSPHVQLALLAPAVSSPATLDTRGRELLRELGYPAPRDVVSGFFVEPNALARDALSRREEMPEGDDPMLRYFYRESDRPIVGAYDAWHPEPRLPWRNTERGVELAPDARLLAFHGPPPPDGGSDRAAADAWRVLWTAAGNRNDPEALQSGPNTWPVDFPDARSPEAAVPSRRMRLLAFWNIAGLVIGLITAGVFGRRAWRHGQVDLGAARHVAASLLVVVPVAWLLVTHHSLTAEHMQNVLRLVAWSLWVAGAAAICFAATSAQAARWWPGAFGPGLRWIRRGKADSSFGMDLLVGTVAGIALALVDRAYIVVPAVFGWPPPSPFTALAYLNLQPQLLGGPAAALGYLFYQAAHLGWLISVNLWWFCLLKLMLRQTALAAAGKVALDTYLIAPATNPWIVGAAYTATGFGTSLWLFIHHGIVAAFVAGFVRATLLNFPLTLSADLWFSPLSGLAFLVAGSLLVAGFRITTRADERG